MVDLGEVRRTRSKLHGSSVSQGEKMGVGSRREKAIVRHTVSVADRKDDLAIS